MVRVHELSALSVRHQEFTTRLFTGKLLPDKNGEQKLLESNIINLKDPEADTARSGHGTDSTPRAMNEHLDPVCIVCRLALTVFAPKLIALIRLIDRDLLVLQVNLNISTTGFSFASESHEHDMGAGLETLDQGTAHRASQHGGAFPSLLVKWVQIFVTRDHVGTRKAASATRGGTRRGAAPLLTCVLH